MLSGEQYSLLFVRLLRSWALSVDAVSTPCLDKIKAVGPVVLERAAMNAPAASSASPGRMIGSMTRSLTVRVGASGHLLQRQRNHV